MREVIFSEEAEKDLDHIEEFIFARWGNRVAGNFTTELAKTVRLLERSAEAFEYSEKLGFHRISINRRSILFYKVTEKEVLVSRAFDARQNYQDKDKWK